MLYEGVTFVEIGPGCFRMGSNKGGEGGDFLGRWCARLGLPWGDQPKPSDEMPVHWVELPRGSWIAKHEVTNAQYEAFDPNHERSKDSPGDNDPVVEVGRDQDKENDMSEKSDKATDPVCGMSVDPATAAASVEHEGRTYRFCGKGCAKSFRADPRKYAKAAVS